MDPCDLVNDQWSWVLGLLPDDLEESAAEKLAIRRRRQVGSAAELLRVALAYSVCDFSLRQTAAWAAAIGLGELSDVAVLKRLRSAADWLGHLVMQCLSRRSAASVELGLPVRLVDATVVSQPGSTGTDWRLHLGLDLRREVVTSFELTGIEGGESFRRLVLRPGEVLVADRAYGHRDAIRQVVEHNAHCVVRVSGSRFPLETATGTPIDLAALLRTLAVGEIGDWQAHLHFGDIVHPIRVVAVHKTEGATEAERARIRREASRKSQKVSARTLQAAAFLVLITDLPANVLPPVEALELYRLRWQIEIAIKRMKSLQHLDHLRAKGPELARCYIFGKLLACILLDDLCERLPAFSPWGFSLRPASREPLAIAATVE